jgi:hypothetical protein
MVKSQSINCLSPPKRLQEFAHQAQDDPRGTAHSRRALRLPGENGRSHQRLKYSIPENEVPALSPWLSRHGRYNSDNRLAEGLRFDGRTNARAQRIHIRHASHVLDARIAESSRSGWFADCKVTRFILHVR